MMIDILSQFFRTLRTFLSVPVFVRDHKLWLGFARNRLVVIALLLLGVLLSFQIVNTLLDWWAQLKIDNPIDAGIQTGYLIGNLASSGYQFMFAGGYKYVVLVVMELLIFHMTLRTHSIVSGLQEELTTDVFLKAQIRMIKVSAFSFGMELVASICIKVVFSIIGFQFLKPIALFLAQSFFLGFALVDNYNEIHNLKIKESFKRTLQYSGVAIGCGIVLYLLILIPLVGPFVGPMVGAIAATLVMHNLDETTVEEYVI